MGDLVMFKILVYFYLLILEDREIREWGNNIRGFIL